MMETIGVVTTAELGENRKWRKVLPLNNLDKETHSEKKYEETVK